MAGAAPLHTDQPTCGCGKRFRKPPSLSFSLSLCAPFCLPRQRSVREADECACANSSRRLSPCARQRGGDGGLFAGDGVQRTITCGEPTELLPPLPPPQAGMGCWREKGSRGPRGGGGDAPLAEAKGVCLTLAPHGPGCSGRAWAKLDKEFPPFSSRGRGGRGEWGGLPGPQKSRSDRS